MILRIGYLALAFGLGPHRRCRVGQTVSTLVSGDSRLGIRLLMAGGQQVWGWLAMQGRDSTSVMGQEKLISKVREVPLHAYRRGGSWSLRDPGFPRPGVFRVS